MRPETIVTGLLIALAEIARDTESPGAAAKARGCLELWSKEAEDVGLIDRGNARATAMLSEYTGPR